MSVPVKLRKQMRALRRAIPRRTRRECAKNLTHWILRTPRLRSCVRVAGYMPHDGEVDILPALVSLRASGTRVYLPVLGKARLQFLPWHDHTPLVLNRYGIPEPALNMRSRCPTQALDLVLVPLVAFDAQGNRLGMGAGYYDRTFAFMRRRRCWRRPLLIGVGYALQEVAALPFRTWDVPLHGVATEKGLRYFRHPPAPEAPAHPPRQAWKDLEQVPD